MDWEAPQPNLDKKCNSKMLDRATIRSLIKTIFSKKKWAKTLVNWTLMHACNPWEAFAIRFAFKNNELDTTCFDFLNHDSAPFHFHF